jgi:hypothetical protein
MTAGIRRQVTETSPAPDDMSRALHEFAKSDRLLLTPARMHDYSGKWVAAHEGKVVAVAADLNTVTDLLLADHIPIAMVAIRFIKEDGMASA